MQTARKVITIALALGFASAAQADPIYTDNVIIILDGSGSMKDSMGSKRMSKMDAAKAALHEVLAQLPETTHVGVYAFSGKVRDPWVYPLGAQDNDEIRRAIDKIRPSGSTPLGAAIKQGADRLLHQRDAQFGYGTYRLLVVTDGEASDGVLVKKYTPDVVARGITVDVIGVKMKTDHTLATKVHSYRRADDPESLQTAIEEVFAEVSNTGADDSAGDAAFDLIAPLSPELTQAMLQALAQSGNQPIGESPNATSASPTNNKRVKTSAPQTTNQNPSTPIPSTPRRRSNRAFWFVMFVIVFTTWIARRAKGRSR